MLLRAVFLLVFSGVEHEGSINGDKGLPGVRTPCLQVTRFDSGKGIRIPLVREGIRRISDCKRANNYGSTSL